MSSASASFWMPMRHLWIAATDRRHAAASGGDGIGAQGDCVIARSGRRHPCGPWRRPGRQRGMVAEGCSSHRPRDMGSARDVRGRDFETARLLLARGARLRSDDCRRARGHGSRHGAARRRPHCIREAPPNGGARCPPPSNSVTAQSRGCCSTAAPIRAGRKRTQQEARRCTRPRAPADTGDGGVAARAWRGSQQSRGLGGQRRLGGQDAGAAGAAHAPRRHARSYDLVWLDEDDEVIRRVTEDPSSAELGCGGVFTAVVHEGKARLLCACWMRASACRRW